MSLEDVYPGGRAIVHTLAPPPGTVEAATFMRLSGLDMVDVYPTLPMFSGQADKRAPRRWRWGWMAVGVLVGAALAGPIGAAVGLAGGLVGTAR